MKVSEIRHLIGLAFIIGLGANFSVAEHSAGALSVVLPSTLGQIQKGNWRAISEKEFNTFREKFVNDASTYRASLAKDKVSRDEVIEALSKLKESRNQVKKFSMICVEEESKNHQTSLVDKGPSKKDVSTFRTYPATLHYSTNEVGDVSVSFTPTNASTLGETVISSHPHEKMEIAESFFLDGKKHEPVNGKEDSQLFNIRPIGKEGKLAFTSSVLKNVNYYARVGELRWTSVYLFCR